ncbi:MAG TPA: putative quinol monooxygenase [Acidimicrobiia bacterium]
MYGLIGRITAEAGSRDALAGILSAMGPVPGCLSYAVALERSDPDALWVTEVWEDEDAHAASLGLPAVREAIERGRSLIASFDQRIETTPVGRIGLR